MIWKKPTIEVNIKHPWNDPYLDWIGPRRRDVEAEDLIEDLRSQLAETQKKNDKLSNKVQLMSQMMTTPTRKPTRYDNVSSRVDTVSYYFYF